MSRPFPVAWASAIDLSMVPERLGELIGQVVGHIVRRVHQDRRRHGLGVAGHPLVGVGRDDGRRIGRIDLGQLLVFGVADLQQADRRGCDQLHHHRGGERAAGREPDGAPVGHRVDALLQIHGREVHLALQSVDLQDQLGQPFGGGPDAAGNEALPLKVPDRLDPAVLPDDPVHHHAGEGPERANPLVSSLVEGLGLLGRLCDEIRGRREEVAGPATGLLDIGHRPQAFFHRDLDSRDGHERLARADGQRVIRGAGPRGFHHEACLRQAVGRPSADPTHDQRHHANDPPSLHSSFPLFESSTIRCFRFHRQAPADPW